MKSIAESLWKLLERIPWLVIAAVVFLHTAFTLGTRQLWFSDEVRYANAYENLVRAGKWVVLYLNGNPYPDKPPVYFWFLNIFDQLPGLNMPEVFFVGAAMSGLLFLLASHVLSRVLGFSRSVSLAAALILCTNFFLLGIIHYSRMDLLFAAFIIGAQALFYRGFTAERGGKSELRCILGGFFLCGLATLTKGPLGLAFPLLTALAFLLVKGEVGRLFSKRMLMGLGVFAGMMVAWLAAALFVEGYDFVHNIVYKQIYKRATNTFHHKEPFYYYFIALPLAWLPWTLYLASARFKGLNPAGWGTAWAQRTEAGPRTWLWLMFLTGFGLLSLLSGKVLIYILPLFPALAILIADAMLGDTSGQQGRPRLKRFWVALAGLYALIAVGLPIGAQFAPGGVTLKGWWMLSAILLAGAALVWICRSYSPRFLLLLVTAVMILWVQPLGRVAVPSLNTLMSPAESALMVRDYIAKGYYPIAYNIYAGIYTYYAGQNIHETDELDEVVELLKAHPRSVLVIQKKRWDPWTDRPASLKLVHEQWIVDRPYYLAVQEDGFVPGNGAADNAAAPEAATDAPEIARPGEAGSGEAGSGLAGSDSKTQGMQTPDNDTPATPSSEAAPSEDAAPQKAPGADQSPSAPADKTSGTSPEGAPTEGAPAHTESPIATSASTTGGNTIGASATGTDEQCPMSSGQWLPPEAGHNNSPSITPAVTTTLAN